MLAQAVSVPDSYLIEITYNNCQPRRVDSSCLRVSVYASRYLLPKQALIAETLIIRQALSPERQIGVKQNELQYSRRRYKER